MNRTFIFSANNQAEASTAAAQQSIAIAERLGLDPHTIRVSSTRRISGNRYSAVLAMPDRETALPAEQAHGPGPIRGSIRVEAAAKKAKPQSKRRR